MSFSREPGTVESWRGMPGEEGHSQIDVVMIGGGKRKEALSCNHSLFFFFLEGYEISQRIRK